MARQHRPLAAPHRVYVASNTQKSWGATHTLALLIFANSTLGSRPEGDCAIHQFEKSDGALLRATHFDQCRPKKYTQTYRRLPVAAHPFRDLATSGHASPRLYHGSLPTDAECQQRKSQNVGACRCATLLNRGCRATTSRHHCSQPPLLATPRGALHPLFDRAHAHHALHPENRYPDEQNRATTLLTIYRLGGVFARHN